MSCPAPHAVTLASRLSAVVLVAVGLVGCDALRGAGELEQAIAREQVAITAYSADVPRVDWLAQAFADALSRANGHRAGRVYREDLAAHAVPAGRAWVEALRAMGGLDSVELQAIHAPLVGAVSALVAALERVVALRGADGGEPSPEGLATQQREVETAMIALRSAERTYAESLALHCAKNRATLTAARPVIHGGDADPAEAK